MRAEISISKQEKDKDKLTLAKSSMLDFPFSIPIIMDTLDDFSPSF